MDEDRPNNESRDDLNLLSAAKPIFRMDQDSSPYGVGKPDDAPQGPDVCEVVRVSDIRSFQDGWHELLHAISLADDLELLEEFIRDGDERRRKKDGFIGAGEGRDPE